MADDVQDDAILATLKEDGEQDAPKDSSPKDKEPEAVKEAEEKPEEKSKEKSKEKTEEKPEAPDKAEKEDPKEEESKEDESEEKVEKPAEEKPSKADERKTQLNTEIRDLVSKRNALKREVEKTNAEVYQPAAENELTDEVNPDTGKPYTSVEAKLESMRQQQEMEKYNTQVAEAQLTISHESERVINDFPIFNPDSTDFDKELAEEAADLLRANLVFDENTNQVIGSNVSPYQLYKTIARAHDSSTIKGQIKGREDTEQMLANADSPGNVAPPSKKKDPVLDILSSDDY